MTMRHQCEGTKPLCSACQKKQDEFGDILQKQSFEAAIKAYGTRKACAYFNHGENGGFANGLVAELGE
jgi:hypothetical protein